MYCSVSLMKIERSQVRPVPFDSPLNELVRSRPSQTQQKKMPAAWGDVRRAREVDTNVLCGDTPKTADRSRRSYPIADLRKVDISVAPDAVGLVEEVFPIAERLRGVLINSHCTVRCCR